MLRIRGKKRSVFNTLVLALALYRSWVGRKLGFCRKIVSRISEWDSDAKDDMK